MRLAWLVEAALLAMSLAGCTGYQAVADPGAGLPVSPMQLNEARITPWIGKRFVLASPVIIGDSVRGLSKDGTLRTVGLIDVKRVEMHVVDAGRSMALIGVVICSIGFAIGQVTSCTPDDSE